MVFLSAHARVLDNQDVTAVGGRRQANEVAAMTLSARNQLPGTIKTVVLGAVMAEVVTRTSGYYRGLESGAIAAGASLLVYIIAWQAMPLLYAHTRLAANWVTLQFVFGIVAAVVAYRRVA